MNMIMMINGYIPVKPVYTAFFLSFIRTPILVSRLTMKNDTCGTPPSVLGTCTTVALPLASLFISAPPDGILSPPAVNVTPTHQH